MPLLVFPPSAKKWLTLALSSQSVIKNIYPTSLMHILPLIGPSVIKILFSCFCNEDIGTSLIQLGNKKIMIKKT